MRIDETLQGYKEYMKKHPKGLISF